MSQESKGRPSTRTITWAGNLYISKDDEVKITKGIVHGNGNISAYRLENITKGREETSHRDGVITSTMPVFFNPPVSGFVHNVKVREGETIFELVEGIGILQVNLKKLLQYVTPSLDKEMVEKCISKKDADAEDIMTSAFRILEERIRAKIGVGYERYGLNLINDAFNPNTGKLTFGETIAEREGLFQLYRGSIGFLKNPPSHRFVDDYSEFEIFEIVIHVNLLLNILDKCTVKTN